jgi:hypothetical protein
MAQDHQGAGVAESVAALAEGGQGLPGVAGGAVAVARVEGDGGRDAARAAFQDPEARLAGQPAGVRPLAASGS